MDTAAAIEILRAAANSDRRQHNAGQGHRQGSKGTLDQAIDRLLEEAEAKGRQEGVLEGAEAAHTLWRKWLAQYRRELAEGKAHQGTTPDGINYACIQPGRHTKHCQSEREKEEERRWPTGQVPPHACAAHGSDYYEGLDRHPSPNAKCPACKDRPPPKAPRHARQNSCPCGAKFTAYGNRLFYWYPLSHYATRPELVKDGGAPCTQKLA